MPNEQAKQSRKRKSGADSTDSNTGGKSGKFNFRFVRIELSQDNKQEFKSLVDSGEFDSISIDDYTKLGYKVSFTIQDDGKTTLCSISCGLEHDPNYQRILTGRGGNSIIALRVAAYKDIYLCEDGVWATGELASMDTTPDIG